MRAPLRAPPHRRRIPRGVSVRVRIVGQATITRIRHSRETGCVKPHPSEAQTPEIVIPAFQAVSKLPPLPLGEGWGESHTHGPGRHRPPLPPGEGWGESHTHGPGRHRPPLPPGEGWGEGHTHGPGRHRPPLPPGEGWGEGPPAFGPGRLGRDGSHPLPRGRGLGLGGSHPAFGHPLPEGEGLGLGRVAPAFNGHPSQGEGAGLLGALTRPSATLSQRERGWVWGGSHRPSATLSQRERGFDTACFAEMTIRGAGMTSLGPHRRFVRIVRA